MYLVRQIYLLFCEFKDFILSLFGHIHIMLLAIWCLEKARLLAEAKAAEEARRKAEVEAEAEAKRKREQEREAARLALQKVN